MNATKVEKSQNRVLHLHLMVRMGYAAIQIYEVGEFVDAKSFHNRESAAFASNRGGFNEYSPEKSVR